jgi:aryl-alcohol dehydrogenase-like predicted oxidoreductase
MDLMEPRDLGRTGLRISPIGLGTTKLGRTEQVKYPTPFELPSDDQINALLTAARRFGVNLIDTAPAYGTSEQRLGALLPARDEWVIVTKAGEEFVDGRSSFDFSPDAIRRSVERSLERLRTSRLDVVLLHCGDDDTEVLRTSGAIEALQALRKQGLIRAYGASTKTVQGGLLAVELCDVVMVALNRQDQSQRPVIEAARQAGVGVLVKKALASGHDTDPERALTEALSVPGVTSVIVGTLNLEHWSRNCEAAKRALSKPSAPPPSEPMQAVTEPGGGRGPDSMS